MAFFEIRSTFKPDELRNTLMNTMTERGVRLRAAHGLEDYLLASDSEDADDGSEAEGEFELEHAASELHRLMPY